MNDRPDRRTFLRLGGVAAAGVALAACARDTNPIGDASPPAEGSAAATGTPSPAATTAGTTLTVADFDGLATCQVLPEQTAGPFPLSEQFIRRDITEGYPGHPLRLGLRVVDADCVAVPGAAVEIWHTDATGDYSAFADDGSGKDEGPGTTFMRGTQVADADGIVEFQTIYPGWYSGRAVHIHLRVHVDEATVLTSQIYFEDGYTAEIFTEAPYAEFGPPDTLLGQDRIAGDAVGESTVVHVTADAATTSGTGTLALLNLGVDA